MRKCFTALAIFGLATALGCGQSSPQEGVAIPPNMVTPDVSKFILETEPSGGLGVIQVRKESKDQDEVVIVGRIGGSENPWVEGRAAFSIVDVSIKSCLECGSMDCPKPWDYC